MNGYIELSATQVALAAALILINGIVSVVLRLEIAGKITIAAIRTIVQLNLLGMVLAYIFRIEDWRLVLLLMAFMTTVAGISAVKRVERPYAGIWKTGLLAMAFSSWVVTAVALSSVVGVRPWYMPQYAIPLLGMILGNTLNGIALGLDRFTGELYSRRNEIETMLALGATRREAALPSIRTAVRTGMIPIINTMMVVGLVSLPGMMTGQLLSGVDPAQAVKYQIVIMFLIAAGTCLGTVIAVFGAYRKLFTHRDNVECLPLPGQITHVFPYSAINTLAQYFLGWQR